MVLIQVLWAFNELLMLLCVFCGLISASCSKNTKQDESRSEEAAALMSLQCSVGNYAAQANQPSHSSASFKERAAQINSWVGLYCVTVNQTHKVFS